MVNKPKVIVAGALGKMGESAMQAFLANSDKFQLVAGVVRTLSNVDKAIVEEYKKHGVRLTDNLEDELHRGGLDILVELTTPDSVFRNSRTALKNGVRPVIGATGLSDDDINELSALAQKHSLGAIIAPNFSLGAILMMKFAAEAAKHMDRYEIIERHHDKKLDAPSGTAIKTAKMMYEASKGRKNLSPHHGEISRGELHHGIPIHSLRLQGYVASQEVVFGGQGQTLTIRHDTIDRSSFMPGILVASEHVMKLDRLVYGLEKVI